MLSYALTTLCVVLCAATQLPDYLKPLQPVWDNEAALTEALRAWDKVQAAKIEELLRAPAPGAAATNRTAEEAEAEAKALSKQVRDAYELAIATHPNSARLHNFYGELLYDRYNDISGALKQWHEALSLDEKLSAVHNNLALHNFHFGEYKTGLHHLDLALKYEKNNPDYLYNMSNLYLVHSPQIADLRKWDEARVYKEAMKLSKRAVKADPTDYDIVQDYAVNFFAAENYKLEADWKEAAAAWETARGIARNEDEQFYCWLNEGRVWLRAKQPERAIPCLEQALRMRPDSAPARQMLDAIKDPETEDAAKPE